MYTRKTKIVINNIKHNNLDLFMYSYYGDIGLLKYKEKIKLKIKLNIKQKDLLIMATFSSLEVL